MVERILRVRFTDARSETIWLTVYADLITNLALIFLALFGLTMLGDDAVRQALMSMKLTELQPLDPTKDPLASVTTAVRREFADDPEIAVIEEAGGLRIRLGEAALFESGRAALKPQAKPFLMRLAGHFKDVPYTVVVEGHTDSIPLAKGARFADNWELSLFRSMSVVEALTASGALEPARVAAAAYGDNRPRGSNMTRLGRRANRRVEIALFKSFRLNRETPKEETSL